MSTDKINKSLLATSFRFALTVGVAFYSTGCDEQPMNGESDSAKSSEMVDSDRTEPSSTLRGEAHADADRQRGFARCDWRGGQVTCKSVFNSLPCELPVSFAPSTFSRQGRKVYRDYFGGSPEAFAKLIWAASNTVCQTLYQDVGEIPSKEYIAIKFDDNYKYPASISGDDVKTLTIGTRYFYERENKNRAQEAMGILVHEMVHVFQYGDAEADNSRAPWWIIEGVADFVRIKTGNHDWRTRKLDAGDNYDSGYTETGWFFVWLDEKIYDFGYEFNQALRSGDGKGWSESKFEDITGRTVQSLWNEYKEWYEFGTCQPKSALRGEHREVDINSGDKYCSFMLLDQCGRYPTAFGEPIRGQWQPRPEGCTKIYAPVCGCDGQTYSNECMANAAGQSIISHSPCAE